MAQDDKDDLSDLFFGIWRNHYLYRIIIRHLRLYVKSHFLSFFKLIETESNKFPEILEKYENRSYLTTVHYFKYSMFGDLSVGLFPNSITKLNLVLNERFGDAFTALKPGVIPHSVENLKIDYRGSPIIGVIPSSVKFLYLKYLNKEENIVEGFIPDSVKILSMDIPHDLEPGMLPKSVVHLTLSCWRPRQIHKHSIPGSVRYLSYNNFSYLDNVPIANNLETLIVISHKQPLLKPKSIPSSVIKLQLATHDIEPGLIPSSVKYLAFSAGTSTIKKGTFPKSLETLDIGSLKIERGCFLQLKIAKLFITLGNNLIIHPGDLPDTITTLTLGTLFQIHPDAFPRSLTYLKILNANGLTYTEFETRGYSEIAAFTVDKFPKSLAKLNLLYTTSDKTTEHPIQITPTVKYLKISNGFNFALSPIPNGVEKIKTTGPFYHTFQHGQLPDSLTSLGIGYGYQQPIVPHALPSSLKRLKMHSYTQPIPKNALPDSLTSLKGCSFDNQLTSDILPPALESIEFDPAFIQKLDVSVLPASLRSITLSTAYPHALHHLPRHIKVSWTPSNKIYLKSRNSPIVAVDCFYDYDSLEVDENNLFLPSPRKSLYYQEEHRL